MNLVTYLQDTISELKLVSWPTRKQTTNLTLIVIAISVVVGAYIGSLDYLFTNILKFVTNK